MPDPYVQTEVRYQGDTCAWCDAPAQTFVVVKTTGRRKMPHKVPSCAACKQRVEDHIEKDLEARNSTTKWKVGDE